MKNNLLLIGCVLTSTNLMANDWDAIPLPVAPDNGKVWQLQEAYSDSFNYTGKPAAFTSKWNDTYFNSWTGPGLTYWQRDESWVSDGNLIINHEYPNPKTIIERLEKDTHYKYIISSIVKHCMAESVIFDERLNKLLKQI